jgi:hypothetical protein
MLTTRQGKNDDVGSGKGKNDDVGNPGKGNTGNSNKEGKDDEK